MKVSFKKNLCDYKTAMTYQFEYAIFDFISILKDITKEILEMG